MTVEQLVAAIHKYVEDNASKDPIFDPFASHVVDAYLLLDFIYKMSGLTPPTTSKERVAAGLKA